MIDETLRRGRLSLAYTAYEGPSLPNQMSRKLEVIDGMGRQGGLSYLVVLVYTRRTGSAFMCNWFSKKTRRVPVISHIPNDFPRDIPNMKITLRHSHPTA